jgi:hypothetical protein
MEAALERASRDKRSLETELERLGREGPQGIVQVDHSHLDPPTSVVIGFVFFLSCRGCRPRSRSSCASTWTSARSETTLSLRAKQLCSSSG